jgi:flagellar motor switch/type III secretory pathway protein FliN
MTNPTSSLLPEQDQPVTEAGQDQLAQNAQALMALGPMELETNLPVSLGNRVALLPVELDVAVPVRDFRVCNLLALEHGQVVETQWGHGEDVPLASGQVQLAWSEFEVVDNQLGVRVTRLA